LRGRQDPPITEPAWLWGNLTSSDEPEIEYVDLATYICRLGLDLAEEFGQEEQQDLRQDRLAGLDAAN
jgi:hypothetical protein